jgi:1-deoxy-D-xylulose-5-phosphate reductoisomerase
MGFIVLRRVLRSLYGCMDPKLKQPGEAKMHTALEIPHKGPNSGIRHALRSAVPAKDFVPKRLSLLGATGSIGASTIDLICSHPGAYKVEVVTAHSQPEKLADIARNLGAKWAVIADESGYQTLKSALSGTRVEVAAGRRALIEAAAFPVDWTMAAIIGAAGLAPTLAAINSGAQVALANKEALVCAGALMIAAAKAQGKPLLPVDSEHNAIFQVLAAQHHPSVRRLLLTASGGPFWQLSLEAMAAVTPAQALAHPIWSMGAKISIDSATMMNKGLELIEASYLFDMPAAQIDIVIHPQSVIHSMVEYVDGSTLAQLGTPDMRTPIAYTLAWPQRLPTAVPSLDLTAIGKLTFAAPDYLRFPALTLARRALEAGGAAPIILNAANEVGVAAFLAGQIPFLAISQLVAATLDHANFMAAQTIDDVEEIDQGARRLALSLMTRF